MMIPTRRNAITDAQAGRVSKSEHPTSSGPGILSIGDIESLTNTIGGRVSLFFGWFGHWASIVIGLIIVLKINRRGA